MRTATSACPAPLDKVERSRPPLRHQARVAPALLPVHSQCLRRSWFLLQHSDLLKNEVEVMSFMHQEEFQPL